MQLDPAIAIIQHKTSERKLWEQGLCRHQTNGLCGILQLFQALYGKIHRTNSEHRKKKLTSSSLFLSSSSAGSSWSFNLSSDFPSSFLFAIAHALSSCRTLSSAWNMILFELRKVSLPWLPTSSLRLENHLIFVMLVKFLLAARSRKNRMLDIFRWRLVSVSSSQRYHIPR